MLMKAISLRQPWAWLMVRPDIQHPGERQRAYMDGRIKPIENRNWSSGRTGWTLIHAAKGMTRDEYADVAYFLHTQHSCGKLPRITLPKFEAIDRGGIVGKTYMTGCVSGSGSPWFFGKYGFLFEHTESLPFTPIKGMLGFFNVDWPAPGVR